VRAILNAKIAQEKNNIVLCQKILAMSFIKLVALGKELHKDLQTHNISQI
jgi:hypothetical protein